MFTITRSPAKVCWHLNYNGILITTGSTKKECQDLQDKYRRKYSL